MKPMTVFGRPVGAPQREESAGGAAHRKEVSGEESEARLFVVRVAEDSTSAEFVASEIEGGSQPFGQGFAFGGCECVEHTFQRGRSQSVNFRAELFILFSQLGLQSARSLDGDPEGFAVAGVAKNRVKWSQTVIICGNDALQADLSQSLSLLGKQDFFEFCIDLSDQFANQLRAIFLLHAGKALGQLAERLLVIVKQVPQLLLLVGNQVEFFLNSGVTESQRKLPCQQVIVDFHSTSVFTSGRWAELRLRLFVSRCGILA